MIARDTHYLEIQRSVNAKTNKKSSKNKTDCQLEGSGCQKGTRGGALHSII